ncbi:MAG TPA: FAD-dependent thymidylate synthase [Candidatus Saccharimonadales bacterium]|nr:FAD-dependent thymidylate synthase [Candidatus Saccharimonadales bacterium]
MAYSARVIADSVSGAGFRLTSLEVCLPRFVLAEFNTHRVFSRNSASSRAIPVHKQLERIKTDPFIPVYWGENQSGMQALREAGITIRVKSEREWLVARDYAVEQVEKLLALNLHKQIPNRLLEPFMWHTVLATSTEWSNFYALRVNSDAQPEIQVAAELMKEEHDKSVPQLVRDGEWHTPLIQEDELQWASENEAEAVKVSSARSGRLSYMTHNNVRDTGEDIKMYNNLEERGHMSPFEHVARPISEDEWQMRKMAQNAAKRSAARQSSTVEQHVLDQLVASLEFDGNLRGWHAHRKDMQYESDFSLRPAG